MEAAAVELLCQDRWTSDVLKNGGGVSIKQLVHWNISLLCCWWRWREAGRWHSPSGRLFKTKRWGGGVEEEYRTPPLPQAWRVRHPECPWRGDRRLNETIQTQRSLCSAAAGLKRCFFMKQAAAKNRKMSATQHRYISSVPILGVTLCLCSARKQHSCNPPHSAVHPAPTGAECISVTVMTTVNVAVLFLT